MTTGTKEKSAAQQNLERNLEAAKLKIEHLAVYVETLEAQLRVLEKDPEQGTIQRSKDPYLDALAEQYSEVQLMTFMQFIEAIESERIVMSYQVREATIFPLVRRNSAGGFTQ